MKNYFLFLFGLQHRSIGVGACNCRTISAFFESPASLQVAQLLKHKFSFVSFNQETTPFVGEKEISPFTTTLHTKCFHE